MPPAGVSTFGSTRRPGAGEQLAAARADGSAGATGAVDSDAHAGARLVGDSVQHQQCGAKRPVVAAGDCVE
jgi:hypothetical protein